MVKIQQFLLPSQPQLIFTARGNGDLSSRCRNPGLYGLAWGWNHWLSRYPFHPFCCHCCCCHSMPHCLSELLHSSTLLPLLPIWTNVSSLSPWLSDFHTTLYSDSSGLLALRSGCNSFYSCAKRQSVFTYASILIRSLSKICTKHII